MNVDRREIAPRAWKLLERTRNSKGGWNQRHYEKLLTGFGFRVRKGGSHTVYIDPEDADNIVVVPRHDNLGYYVANDAIEAIETVLRREGENPHGRKDS